MSISEHEQRKLDQASGAAMDRNARRVEINKGTEILREVETRWLAAELGRSIANLGYPVGCGVEPHPEHLMKAANKLFDRYAKMIELARLAM